MFLDAIATTSSIYAHLLPGIQEEAALRFDHGIANVRRERGIGQPNQSPGISASAWAALFVSRSPVVPLVILLLVGLNWH